MNMSASDGKGSAPVRPIPIHLARAPGLDEINFRLPRSPEKAVKPVPSLWSPAHDICSSQRQGDSKVSCDLPRKSDFSVLRSMSSGTAASTSSPLPLQTSSSRTSTTTSVRSPAVSAKSPSMCPPTPSGEVLHDPPLVRALLYEQLRGQFPNGLDNPLTVLASKRLFPILLGAPESIVAHPAHSTTSSHTTLPLTIPERNLALQNALTYAQSRAVIERIASSHPSVQRASMMQLPPTQSLPLHHAQQSPQQLSPNQQQPTISHLQHPVQLPERPISLQNALALAQSRALLERVHSNPILGPVMTLDNSGVQGYGRKFFPCPQCRYTTDRRNNLKRHMLTMHQTSPKMLECCGILFSTKASLREHAMIFHYHGYTCYFCGRRFCRKALLKRHLSVHNGQKDFVCNVCDYATSHKSNLERHRKVHSRQDDGKEGDDAHRYHDDDAQQYHDDVKSNGSENISHDDVSSDDLSVCSDYEDDIDVEINVHSD